MEMVFRILLLRDDRTYEVKERGPAGSETYLGRNKGLYVIDPKAIQPFILKDKIKGSEILFFESNSCPVPIFKPKPPEAGKPEEADPSTQYLDNFIYKNALEQTGDPQILSMMSHLSGLIGPMLNPGNLVKVILFGLLLQAIIRGLIWP